MFDYRGRFVSPNTPARGQFFINSVASYAMMLQMLWMMTIMPHHYFIIASSKSPHGEGIRARTFGSCQEMGYFTREGIEYDLPYQTAWGPHFVDPSLSRWFRTSDHQSRYRKLPHNVYSDILFATTMSRRGNKCAQIFDTNFGWSCSFTMKLKSEAHEALSLLFQQDRVAPAVMCDNIKEIIFGEFNRNLKEALCHLKQMEPFILWSNAAKREIKELKKCSGRKFIKSGAPKRLWD